jgi:hypothetical protein
LGAAFRHCFRFSMKFPLLLSLLALAAAATSPLQAQAPAAPAAKVLNPREWWITPDPKPPVVNPDASRLSRLRVDGNAFVNEKGEHLLFRGVSVPDPDRLEYQGHWNRKLFEEVKSLGANIVRLPVHPVGWRLRTPGKYLELIDQAANWCSELGLYVIIDWHTIGNLRTDLYQDDMYITTRAETAAFWRAIARRYGKHHTIAFYELFNEPTSYGGQLGRVSWPEWRETNEELIALVRANGGTGIPLVAGFDWAYDLTPLHEDPVRAVGVGYITHPYANKRHRPWEPKWEEDFAFAAAKYPLIASEIGFELAPGEKIDDDHYANRVTRFLEARGISWLAWVYDQEWWPGLLKSWDNYELNGIGAFFKEALHRPAAKPVPTPAPAAQ